MATKKEELLREARKQVLLEFLNQGLSGDARVKSEDVTPDVWENGDFTSFQHDTETYLVLNPEEATAKANELIKDSLWAFRADFLIRFLGLNDNPRTIDAFQNMQEQLREEANPLIEAMLGDKFDAFCKEAILADGRGHFISNYDGKEEASRGYFIYRIN